MVGKADVMIKMKEIKMKSTFVFANRKLVLTPSGGADKNLNLIVRSAGYNRVDVII